MKKIEIAEHVASLLKCIRKREALSAPIMWAAKKGDVDKLLKYKYIKCTFSFYDSGSDSLQRSSISRMSTGRNMTHLAVQKKLKIL